MKKRVVFATVATPVLLLLLIALLTACSGSKAKSSSAATADTSVKTSTAPAADPPPGYKPYSGSDHIIASTNPQAKAVTLDIIGGQGNAGSGFNFNGYSKGDMIVEVPEGWRVSVDFTVDSSLSHSIIITPWSQRQAGSFTKAFSGASIPNYSSGIHKGDPAAHFSFQASKAGKYAMVCAVPGHDDLGMWDQFDVVSGLAKPEVLVK